MSALPPDRDQIADITPRRRRAMGTITLVCRRRALIYVNAGRSGIAMLHCGRVTSHVAPATYLTPAGGLLGVAADQRSRL